MIKRSEYPEEVKGEEKIELLIGSEPLSMPAELFVQRIRAIFEPFLSPDYNTQVGKKEVENIAEKLWGNGFSDAILKRAVGILLKREIHPRSWKEKLFLTRGRKEEVLKQLQSRLNFIFWKRLRKFLSDEEWSYWPSHKVTDLQNRFFNLDVHGEGIYRHPPIIVPSEQQIKELNKLSQEIQRLYKVLGDDDDQLIIRFLKRINNEDWAWEGYRRNFFEWCKRFQETPLIHVPGDEEIVRRVIEEGSLKSALRQREMGGKVIQTAPIKDKYEGRVLSHISFSFGSVMPYGKFARESIPIIFFTTTIPQLAEDYKFVYFPNTTGHNSTPEIHIFADSYREENPRGCEIPLRHLRLVVPEKEKEEWEEIAKRAGREDWGRTHIDSYTDNFSLAQWGQEKTAGGLSGYYTFKPNDEVLVNFKTRCLPLRWKQI